MIQQLTDRELFLLEDMAPSFHKECGLPGALVFPVFKKNWERFIQMGFGAMFVQMNGGKIVGALGGLLYPDCCDDVLVATEMFWYVQPDHRHGLGPIRLLKEFEAWAKKRGAGRLIMAAFMNEHYEKVQSLYHRIGYRTIETHYCKTL